MPVGFCPQCNGRYVYNSYDVDYVHQCNSGQDILDKEPVMIIGDYETEGTTTTVQENMQMRGLENKLEGTDADLKGETLGDLNIFGKRKTLYRLRPRFAYIPKDKLGA